MEIPAKNSDDGTEDRRERVSVQAPRMTHTESTGPRLDITNRPPPSTDLPRRGNPRLVHVRVHRHGTFSTYFTDTGRRAVRREARWLGGEGFGERGQRTPRMMNPTLTHPEIPATVRRRRRDRHGRRLQFSLHQPCRLRRAPRSRDQDER